MATRIRESLDFALEQTKAELGYPSFGDSRGLVTCFTHGACRTTLASRARVRHVDREAVVTEVEDNLDG